jgi:hypothetical protein
MPYRYDLFISYTWRVPRAQSWVREVLTPLLVEFLQLEAAIDKSRVFLDDREVRPGMQVDQTVRDALLDSKVLLAVLSPQYFESGWCLTEFHTMLDRQQQTQQRLVYPLAVWDGTKYPQDVRNLNPLNFNQWGTLERGMARKRFRDTIVTLVKELDQLITKSPNHDPTWVVNVIPDPVEAHVARQGY